MSTDAIEHSAPATVQPEPAPVSVLRNDPPDALPTPMETSDYPAFFISTDAAALSAQRTQTRMARLEIALTLTAGIVGALRALIPATIWGLHAGNGTAILAVVLFTAALLVSTTRQTQRYDKRWADSRSAAETIKTLTWQYMMRVQPYDTADSAATRQFLDDVQDAIRSGSSVVGLIGALPPGANAITPYMTKLRGLPLTARRDVYLRDRIEDQCAWYARKAAANERTGQFWFVAGAVAKIVALVGAALSVTNGHSPAIITLLSGIATAVIAMGQTNKSEELARAYGLAAENLMALKPLVSDVVDEAGLAETVSRGETILSQEYSEWHSKHS